MTSQLAKQHNRERAVEKATRRIEQRYGELLAVVMRELTLPNKGAMSQTQALRHIAKIERVVQGRWIAAFGVDVLKIDTEESQPE